MSCARAGTGRTLLKLSPLLVPLALLFAGGLALAVAQSLGYMLPFDYHGGRFDAYANLLTERCIKSAALSLYVAVVSAGLSVAVGSVLAYGIWRLPERLERAAIVYKVPLILPHIAVAFIVLIFWSKSGVVSAAAYHAGLVASIDQFPSVLFSGNGLGMILAYTYKEIPFTILLAYAVLKRMDPQLVTTASMLGASEPRVFLRVVLPHMAKTLHTTFIILFLYSFGAFDIPFLLGESTPGMLSIEVYNLYFRRELADRPTAMAILTCMFLFSLFFIWLYTRVAKQMQPRERKL
ncbi:ABC transporter permease [Salidesulfovibrio brasiliensis]|uniref:ABC transporter permease n=1 Tax=Salidesulfovibrio brasiliensis TaxID=221711 RepID=UPI0006D2B5F0|nr:ABC transporter permease subunit [Salidesulfovibrio brasiliensis]